LWLAVAAIAGAQETVYVSDKLYVPIRSGAGGDYCILHKGIPSGNALTQLGINDDETWAEVETRGGIRGFMRAQFIQSSPPAAMRVSELEEQLQQVTQERDRLRSSLSNTQSEATEVTGTASELRDQLTAVEAELTEVKRVSAAALELDAQNRTLTTELETLRADAELLRLENVRLQERISNAQIIDGALAVLLGVAVTVVVPRLVPRRRRNDGWS
jgi:SH3 domain protein